jgi:hypothetical protein
MAMNAEWHKKNRMPKNVTLEQRSEWHVEHQKHCDCRKLTEKQKKEMGIK